MTFSFPSLVIVQRDFFHEQSGPKDSNHRQGQKPKFPFFSHATFQMLIFCVSFVNRLNPLLSRAERSASFTLGRFTW